MTEFRRSVYWSLFLLLFAAEFAAGYYVSRVIGFVHTDNMSRVANAFYVLYSRNPHLGAIGFVWNPLPSLIELVFLLPYRWFPALASSALAGVLMSSLFAGMTAVMLARAALAFGLSRWFALLFSILFSFNPFIFLFGANGLSDAPFIFFIMYAVIHFCHWINARHVASLIKVSFALALAFWTRYEAVPLGAMMGLAVFLIVMLIPPLQTHPSDKVKRALKYKLFKVEGTVVLLLAPIVYSGLMWLWLNYMIMNDPLYFLRGEYSNTALAEALKNDKNFVDMIGNPLLTLWFIAKKAVYYSIPLFGVVLLRLWNRRWMAWDFIVLLLLYGSILALQFLLIIKGTSYGFFRYFLYVLPITVAWLPYELSRVRRSFINYSIVLLSLLLTAGVLTKAWTNPEIAPDENKFLNAAVHASSQQLEKEIAKYIDEELQGYNLLMDSYSAYAIILNSKNPSKLLITSDYMFRESLMDPVGTGVDFILSPKPGKDTALSADNQMHPYFYEQGAPWAKLYKEFGGRWRLYQVIREEDGGKQNE